MCTGCGTDRGFRHLLEILEGIHPWIKGDYSAMGLHFFIWLIHLYYLLLMIILSLAFNALKSHKASKGHILCLYFISYFTQLTPSLVPHLWWYKTCTSAIHTET